VTGAVPIGISLPAKFDCAPGGDGIQFPSCMDKSFGMPYTIGVYNGGGERSSERLFSLVNAGIAQLVEQLICNQQVVGSNPSAGSMFLAAVPGEWCVDDSNSVIQ
jgi:hypothetical protein